MELVSDRRYRFTVPPDTLWSTLAATNHYRSWWPWLRAFDDGGGLTAGADWRCTIRPPLPYTLRFRLHLDDVDRPRFVLAHLTGDIAGTARLDVTSRPGGSELHLTSALAPSSRAFGVLATVARPLVRRGHDWVLDTGAGQFAAHIPV